jgi:DNA-directed RNA polymerase specialized sigma24 family protein
MSSIGSVTRWIEQLKAGDRAAVQPLWDRYFRRLVGLARNRLRGLPRREADESDVALNAFYDFCRVAEQGGFLRLDDRDDLWQLLAMITARKATNLAKYLGRMERDWKRTEGLEEEAREALARDPDPAEAAALAEQTGRLLALLDEGQMRDIALHKLEGHTNSDIAKKVGCSLSNVERKLPIIRKRWERELSQ